MHKNESEQTKNKAMKTMSRQSRDPTLHSSTTGGDCGTGHDSVQSKQLHGSPLKYVQSIFSWQNTVLEFTGLYSCPLKLIGPLVKLIKILYGDWWLSPINLTNNSGEQPFIGEPQNISGILWPLAEYCTSLLKQLIFVVIILLKIFN